MNAISSRSGHPFFCLSKSLCRKLYTSNKQEINSVIQWPRSINAQYQLVNYLTSYVFFSDDNYLACLKPYGMKSSPKRTSELSNEICIRFAMPLLSEAFGVRFLNYLHSSPTNSAGIILFGKNSKAVKLYEASARLAVKDKLPYLKILCICLGTPDPLSGEEMFHVVKIKAGDDIVFEAGDNNYSKRQILQRRCNVFPMQYKTLTSRGDFSLVEVHTLSHDWHNYRLFLTHKGAPILGDAIYQQRIARILGKPVLVDPKSAGRKNQYVPVDFLKSAGLSLADYFNLPLYNVVQEMVILKGQRPAVVEEDKGPKLRQPLYLKCPLPAYFYSVMSLLFPDFQHDFNVEE